MPTITSLDPTTLTIFQRATAVPGLPIQSSQGVKVISIPPVYHRRTRQYPLIMIKIEAPKIPYTGIRLRLTSHSNHCYRLWAPLKTTYLMLMKSHFFTKMSENRGWSIGSYYRIGVSHMSWTYLRVYWKEVFSKIRRPNARIFIKARGIAPWPRLNFFIWIKQPIPFLLHPAHLRGNHPPVQTRWGWKHSVKT